MHQQNPGGPKAPQALPPGQDDCCRQTEDEERFSLTLHNYGEELCVGLVEFNEEMTVTETTRLMRRIRQDTAKIGIVLNSVGIFVSNIDTPRKAVMWNHLLVIIRKHPEILRAYAFSYEDEFKTASFLVVLTPE